jgi:hypothetical protein
MSESTAAGRGWNCARNETRRPLVHREAARAANADRVEITLDAVDGHPTEILIDYRVKAIDDEACYRITDYSVDS